MQAGVAAVILDVVCGLGAKVLKTKKLVLYLVMVAAFVATVVFNVNVIYIILVAAGIGILLEVGKKTGKKSEG